MTLEEFVAYQKRTFIAYFLRLIDNEASDAHDALDREGRRKVNFSALSPELFQSLAVEDEYDVDTRIFQVLGIAVPVQNIALGQALSVLTPQRRTVILLFYFLGRNEPQISTMLHLSVPTINYHRKVALDFLRKELEAMGYEL